MRREFDQPHRPHFENSLFNIYLCPSSVRAPRRRAKNALRYDKFFEVFLKSNT
jgi:hypothetical protein